MKVRHTRKRIVMKNVIKGAAKRLAFSLLAMFVLGGCAVYGPGYDGPYADRYGEPYYVRPGYAPYPAYFGPPVYLNFEYRLHGHRDRGHFGDPGPRHRRR